MTRSDDEIGDPYLEWARGEGVPVIEDFGVDLLTVETGDWARTGARGALVLLKGRGDFVDVVVTELPPGGGTDPQRHLYEEVVYVLSGHGSTAVESADGRSSHSFEWGPKSMFAIPLNARYRHYNTSGQEPARLAAVTSLPVTLNLFHDERFVFENPWAFGGRYGSEHHFAGDGTLIPGRPGREIWETNFVPDMGVFELHPFPERGAGGNHMLFMLADGTMHAHMSEMPVGTYKKGHRHGPDFHIFPVTGHGYTLLWYEGDEEFRRVDWQHGTVFAPPDQMFHQHFNTSTEPARYLAVAFGNLWYPFVEEKRKTYEGVARSLAQGGRQIEYADEDPRIQNLFVEELTRQGIEPHMDAVRSSAAS